MILYVNACVRPESRTERIAKALLEKLGGEYKELRLCDMDIAPILNDTLEKRNSLIAEGRFDDPMFDRAHLFADADSIVIAAPFWDYSYPSILKVFLENIYVIGIVSEYTADGRPHGLCRADNLYYVTTAGGRFVPDYSYDHIKRLATDCFGIDRTQLIMADMLDVDGYDAEKILSEVISNIDAGV